MNALGAELRDEGIERATTKLADTHPATWRAANRWLINQAADTSGGTFTSEDLIAHLEGRGLITGDQNLRWLGGLFVHASRAKLIKRVDYAPSSRPGRHCGPVAVWVAGERGRHIVMLDRERTISDLAPLLAERAAAFRRDR